MKPDKMLISCGLVVLVLFQVLAPSAGQAPTFTPYPGSGPGSTTRPPGGTTARTTTIRSGGGYGSGGGSVTSTRAPGSGYGGGGNQGGNGGSGAGCTTTTDRYGNQSRVCQYVNQSRQKCFDVTNLKTNALTTMCSSGVRASNGQCYYSVITIRPKFSNQPQTLLNC